MSTDANTELAELIANALDSLADVAELRADRLAAAGKNPRHAQGQRSAYRHGAAIIRANFATPKELARCSALLNEVNS